MKGKIVWVVLPITVVVFVSASALGSSVGGSGSPIIPQLTPSPTFSDSTVPTVPLNIGDVNPYGVAFVPQGFPAGGPLNAGDIIVSNFNNSANLQGTGTTIVRVNHNAAAPTLFFQGNEPLGSLGLTTALGVLKAGFVLVGNLPSTDSSGTCTAVSVGQGGLLVIDNQGHLVTTLADAQFLNGPWDLTLTDSGTSAQVFVANALSGTVTRLDLSITAGAAGGVTIQKSTQIASGYVHRCDPAAFVVGPTGVALDAEKDVLYVSSTGDNAIFAIQGASTRTSDAGTGEIFIKDAHLHGPLGLVLAPNGDLISTQGDAIALHKNQPSEVVEFSSKGQFLAQFSVDPALGSAFGLALRTVGDGFIFATVDDANPVSPVLDTWVVE
jgi:hypothetical protein